MRAVVFDEFGVLPQVCEVPDPVAAPGGVVIEVEATGVCRSDWHSWQGHDATVTLPHVAGHELAGRIVELGEGVRGWEIGARVTVPFVCACGSCAQCASGNEQICDREFQPGATHWGSFAERVAIGFAEVNLVALPDSLSSVEAAALGCRFGTAFRAVLRQGAPRPGNWVAVYGCGGAGISSVLPAVAASLVTGRTNGTWSISCSEPCPQRICGARPPSTSIGELFCCAEAMALMPFVTPGPAVSAATPGWRVTFAQPSAAKAAVDSWRTSMRSMPSARQPSKIENR